MQNLSYANFQGVLKKFSKVYEKDGICVEIVVLKHPQRSNLSTHDKGIRKNLHVSVVPDL